MISCKEYVTIEKEKIKEKVKDNHKRLDIFQVGDNQASNSYIKGKLKDCEEVGIEAILHKYDEDIDSIKLGEEIYKIPVDSNGIIIQLPLPKHLNGNDLMLDNALPKQDVDGFVWGTHDPCTPKGIINWLEANDINLDGKNVVIIGRSEIVGKPLAKMMVERNATVTLCHSHTKESTMKHFCQHADIIVVAVGKPKWLRFNIYDRRPIIIDVGINRDENNKLCGDVDREFMEEQGCYVTPVPGGVGLLTRLALLQNVVE